MTSLLTYNSSNNNNCVRVPGLQEHQPQAGAELVNQPSLSLSLYIYPPSPIVCVLISRVGFTYSLFIRSLLLLVALFSIYAFHSTLSQ